MRCRTVTVTVTVTVTDYDHEGADMTRQRRNDLHKLGEGVGKRGRARAAAYEVALGEAKELIVALDCVEIDELAPAEVVIAAQDLADRVAAMLTKLIRSAEAQQR